MPPVRNGNQKWKNRSSAAQADYKEGIARPRRNWEEATRDAQPAWEQGVQKAIAEGRYARGVQKSGNARWQSQAQTVGAARFVQGVQASGDRYQQGFAPYARTIESITLPARGPKGDPSNYDRVRVIGEALHAQKTGNSNS